MFEDLLELDLDVADVGALQMALRTLLIYTATMVIMRAGSKRFLSQATAFDAIVAIHHAWLPHEPRDQRLGSFPTHPGG